MLKIRTERTGYRYHLYKNTLWITSDESKLETWTVLTQHFNVFCKRYHMHEKKKLMHPVTMNTKKSHLLWMLDFLPQHNPLVGTCLHVTYKQVCMYKLQLNLQNTLGKSCVFMAVTDLMIVYNGIKSFWLRFENGQRPKVNDSNDFRQWQDRDSRYVYTTMRGKN
jgi:hypothetical protein